MPRVFLVANVMEGIGTCMCAVGRSPAPEPAAAAGGGSAVLGHAAMIRAGTRAVGVLTHTQLPQGGHSRSWHRPESIKVPSDSSDEPADDRSLLALEVIPVDCWNSKGAAGA